MSSLFEIPDHYLVHQQDNIYTISAASFVACLTAYRQSPLPNDILFPWLHGVNGQNNQQNLFFGVRRCLPPNYRGLIVLHCGDPHKARLVDTVLPDQIIRENEFLQTSTTQINLRSFGEQPVRFAALSDIVLYGTEAQTLASQVAHAQTTFYASRQLELSQVQKTAGKRAVSNANQMVYKTILIQDDFSLFEKEYPELVMYDSNGLIVHQIDFQQLELAQMRDMSKATEITPNVWMGNTQDAPLDDDEGSAFSICIEAHDLADMPLPSTLTLAREILKDTRQEVIHFDVYGTGVPTDKPAFDVFYSRLMGLMEFIREQTENNHRILIHCSDGYTETSLFGLSWIMYYCQLSLPKAYLYLQQRRSFFVYAADLSTLRQIEQALFDQETVEPEPKRKKSIPDRPHRILQSDAYLNTVSNELDEKLPDYVYEQLQLSPTPKEQQLHPWFYSPRFEGSFPSRILPFLYLGNLNHATNPEMLKVLQITHVVSVGENADLSKKDFELLYLDNLYDDGIDSIRARLETVEAFIEDARQKKGICLIHCRVGVSRSAAIAICYVMKHLNLGLVEAYLFVRARRLNVIIQPNLKFMYEMLQLEQQRSGTIRMTWPVLCNEINHLNALYKDCLEAEK